MPSPMLFAYLPAPAFSQLFFRHTGLNRHNGFVNSIFLDWSARKVGLKELWTLKWHRSYGTDGPWTRDSLATLAAANPVLAAI